MKSKASTLATSLLRNRSPHSILKVECLHHGVVVGVHAANEAALGEDLLVVLAGIGTPMVRVVEKTDLGAASPTPTAAA